jgi:hypothetical protein
MNKIIMAIIPFLLSLVLSSLGNSVFAQTDNLNSPVNDVSVVETEKLPSKEAEFYFGLFGGNAHYSDTQVTATYQCFFCSPITATKNIHFSKGEISGIRIGWWGGNKTQNLGVAFEFTTTNAKSRMIKDEVNARYESFSIMPMLRIPFFKSDSMPGGYFNLYGGAGFSRVMSGNISVTFPELPRTVSGNAKGTGSIFLIGISLKFSRVILSVEQRAADTNLSFSDIGGSGDARINAKQTIFGAACRF